MDDAFARPELVESETVELFEEREERYTEWFQPRDNTLKVSGGNCAQVRDIFVSKLSRKEKEAAMKDASETDLKKSMLEIQTKYFEKQDRRYSSERAKKVVDGFMAFGGIFIQVLNKALSNEPAEYGAAFAVVNCIYKGIKEKNDREEKLSDFLQRVTPIIDQKSFYHQAINTPKMRDAFSAFWTGIVKFVVAADKYCTKRSLVKLIISTATNDPLQHYYDEIKKCIDAIENLRMAASLALLLEQRANTNKITTVLYKMYEKVTMPTIAPESTAILSLVRYKSHARAQKLTLLLNLPHFSLAAEKAYNDARRIHLASRDQWESNDSVIDFRSWESHTPRPLLWLSGPEKSPGVSWVSSFSVDLIDALAATEKLVAVYIFCANKDRDDGRDGGRSEKGVMTPLLVLKRLIKGIVEVFPQITIDHVEMLSLSLFNEIGTSSSSFKAWDLLVEVLNIVQDVMVEQKQSLYIIIDRLDLCVSGKDGFGVRNELIPGLQEVAMRLRNVEVVVTSTVKASKVGTLKQEPGLLWPVWIDIGGAVDMDNAEEYDD